MKEQNNFDIFDNILEIYDKEHNNNITPEFTCEHKDLINQDNNVSCLKCGETIKTITHDQEWRYYGSTDNKRKSDPTRVQERKEHQRNINKDVESMGFSRNIIEKANEIYTKVTKGQIFRGDSRKSIIFACIYHAYKIDNNFQMPKNLIQIFNISKKSSLRGMKIVKINMDDNIPFQTTISTTEHHINDIMTQFSSTDEQKQEVYDLYHRIKNRSSKLNRSRPQSVSISLIYYWILKNKKPITIKQYSKQVNLSEMTINKNINEIRKIIET